MADNQPINPLLLRFMRNRGLGQSTNTIGAGIIDPNLLRQLQGIQPRIGGGMGKSMPGFAPARPGAGFMPNKGNPNLTQGEQLDDIIEPDLLTSEHIKPLINKPVPGGNLDPSNIPNYGSNDAVNPLQRRLDNLRKDNSDDFKYRYALNWQKANREQDAKFKEPQRPLGTLSPLSKDITPQQELSLKQIYTAARQLDQQGNKQDAAAIRRFNHQTEQFRDKLKDYNLAHSDLKEWVNQNAVDKDPYKALEDMERINKFLKFSKEPELTMFDYREMKRYELQQKMQRQGPDNFFAELKNNLTSMHGELNRLRSLIEQNQGE